jgi:hypothetical protein
VNVPDWVFIALAVAAVAIAIGWSLADSAGRWRQETEEPLGEQVMTKFNRRHDAELAEHPGRES